MMFYQKYYDVAAWGKLYRKELFTEIRYPKGKIFEDNGTTYKLFDKANSISFSSIIGYYYVQRKNSILSSKYTSKKMDGILLGKEMLNFISNRYSKQVIKAATCRYVSICFSLLLQIDNNSVEDLKVIEDEIKRNRRRILLDFHSRIKTKIACLLSYLSFSLFLK